ncbi:MAG: VCBS repeat-containing protein, partial [Myxococcales bacterium]|nr:VCBS repeat-containing protein [Myxococcales bacterium]
AGATFDAKTGVLSWTPTVTDAGPHPGITIIASDGTHQASVSFTITVVDPNAVDPDAVDPDAISDDINGTGDTTPQPDFSEPCGSGETICGSTCCTGSQLCFEGSCITPSTGCKDNLDCKKTEYCDPIIGKCLPEPSKVCEYHPPVGLLQPALKWKWEGLAKDLRYDKVTVTPAVGFVNGDQYPDVVFNVYRCGDGDEALLPGANCKTFLVDDSIVVALSGKDGSEIWDTLNPTGTPILVNGYGHPALADIDGDGRAEIFNVAKGGGIVALRSDGTLLWQNSTGVVKNARRGSIVLVDINHDGVPEVVAGFLVLDAKTGALLWSAPDTPVGDYGGVKGYFFSIAHDFDGDGFVELTDGRRLFRLDKQMLQLGLIRFGNHDGNHPELEWTNPAIGTATRHPSAAAGDIYPFDKPDGKPEIIAVHQPTDPVNGIYTGKVSIIDPKDGKELWSKTFPGRGGAPVLADMDGDGLIEIGLAARSKVYVFDPKDGTNGILWEDTTQDFSSEMTSISVFDFEGDGKVEVVYNDECFLRVYNGSKDDGTPGFKRVFFEWPNSSRTQTEYPVIVDVDNDYKAEIIVPGNNDYIARDKCIAAWKAKGFTDYPTKGSHGIYVFKDLANNWVNTRKVWNQHAYHITNINDNMSVPPIEPFDATKVNSYRQNVQGQTLFNAPDFTAAKLDVFAGMCPTKLVFAVTVVNQGSRATIAGLPVAFYVGTAPTGTLIGVTKTKKIMPPGASETVVFEWNIPQALQGSTFDVFARIDDDGTGNGTENECENGGEDNNVVSLTGIKCGSSTGTNCPQGQTVPEPEICDGKDNNCNGKIDEGLVRKCSTACGDGIEICDNGKWSNCNAPKPTEEVCDGLDNNCDGQVDEGFPKNACGTCGVAPTETCDGIDNNCNGEVDEGSHCGSGLFCSCGTCAKPCISGECFDDSTCLNGLCIPNGLVNSCVSGQ